MEFSEDQEYALREMNLFCSGLRRKAPGKTYVLTVGGYAGTGKTTLIAALRNDIPKHWNIGFCAFTGKASSVLESKLTEFGSIRQYDYVGTIHSLIYNPRYEHDPIVNKKKFIGFVKKETIPVDLIIIDEASMVGRELWKDLTSFETPIIAVGDHGQLGPVETAHVFNLMQNPEIKLEKIHRQALNDPIIYLSLQARTKGYIEEGVYSPFVLKTGWKKAEEYFNKIDMLSRDTMVLCGTNYERVNLTHHVRKSLGFRQTDPYPGERLICLRNNRKVKNGQLGTMIFTIPLSKNLYDLTVEMDAVDANYQCACYCHTFGKVDYRKIFSEIKNNEQDLLKEAERKKFRTVDIFDYGYVSSVHKSQGSEWDTVVVFEATGAIRRDDEGYKRWLYTAVTRSKKRLLVIDQ